MSDLRIQRNVGGESYEVKPFRNQQEGDGFGEFIKGAVEKVNNMEARANQSVEKLMMGKTGIHETMIALQKADISLRFLLQVRNKAMDAYREIMRMQF